jgi:hypothetical protein
MTQSTRIKLTYANWRFFSSWTANFGKETGDGAFDGDWDRLIHQTEDTEDKNALKRHQAFIAVASPSTSSKNRKDG